MSSMKTMEKNNLDYIEEGRSFAQDWISETEQRRIDDLVVTLSDVDADFIKWSSRNETLWNPLLPIPRPTSKKERLFLRGFMLEPWEQQCVRRESLRHRCYSRGLEIGKKWVAEIATDQELLNLAEFIPDSLNGFASQSVDIAQAEWTESHHLQILILDEGVFDDSRGKPDPLSDVYFEFWNQLLESPINKETFAAEVTPSHPLRSGSFVIGFADGALGISDQLK